MAPDDLLINQKERGARDIFDGQLASDLTRTQYAANRARLRSLRTKMASSSLI